MEEPYKNREIDEMFGDIQNSLSRIEVQTNKTNGRVTRLERTMLIVVTAVIVMLGMNSPIISKVIAAAL